VPRLPGVVRPLVPVADAFMIAMLSRPSTGSLRSTWVTPATVWLSVLTTAGGLVAALLVHPGAAWLAALALVLFIVAAAGAASVALVALAQRLAA
jgi:hypothetical protein